MRRALARIWF